MPGARAFALASFKLRFRDVHVRAVPARDLEGCPFAGPGVDLRGDDARAVLTEVAPLEAWLAAHDPGDARSGDARSGDATSGDATSGDATSGDATSGDARSGDARSVLRALSMDLVRSRVLVALEDVDRPRVLRFDPPIAKELEALAIPLLRVLEEKVAAALRRRADRP